MADAQTAMLPGSFHGGGDASAGTWWTFAAVEERLIEAIGFLDRLPERSLRRSVAGDGPWGQIVRDRLVDWVDMEELAEARGRDRSALTTVEVDRMNETLEWVTRHVPARGELRRLVGMVTTIAAREGGRTDWLEVRRRGSFKQSKDALRMLYSRSVGRIAERLNVEARRTFTG